MNNTKILLTCITTIFLGALASVTQAADALPNDSSQPDVAAIQKTVLAIENAILDRWDNGDPMGFVEVSADDVTYFGPERGTRVDGKQALKELFTPIIGKIHNPPRRMEDTMVRVYGDLALLTFVAIYEYPDGKNIWNTTEVYRRIGNEWKLTHSHWMEARKR